MPESLKRRFQIAMAAYLLLAAAAWVILGHELLWLTWFVLAAFAFKTGLVVLKRRLDSEDR